MRRTFVNFALCKGEQFFLRRGGTVNQFDIGTRHLAGMGIGLTNRTSKSHGLVTGQGLFDFGRINVVPATNDQIFRAARDPNIAIRIDATQIASAQILHGIAQRRPLTGIEQVLVFGGLRIGFTVVNTG